MGDTLHKMEVKIEGDSSGLKKEMESSRQEVKRGVEAIQKETEKMKNPFRNLASSKTLSSVRASMKKIKDSFASVWKMVASAAVVAGVVSILTSVAGIPEVEAEEGE